MPCNGSNKNHCANTSQLTPMARGKSRQSKPHASKAPTEKKKSPNSHLQCDPTVCALHALNIHAVVSHQPNTKKGIEKTGKAPEKKRDFPKCSKIILPHYLADSFFRSLDFFCIIRCSCIISSTLLADEQKES